jgi:4-diphosphocytidyl-2-C-methyl-D-erythritol kinase
VIIEEFAPAKVNLWLRITGRRADGYHTLDSLVVFADIGDTLRAEPAETLSLTVEGPFAAALPDAADNLVLRAARALAPGRGARLTLTKNLPVASGIGGGSADAAAALRALTRLWDLDPALAARVAPTLGADLPVCLAGQPAIMQGIGDDLSPAPALPRFGLLLVNPGIALATRAVFAARRGDFQPAMAPSPWPDAATLAADLMRAGNALTDAAITLCGAVKDVLATLGALPGVLAAQLSGSGATCFALLPAAPAATIHAARADLLARHPGWWVAACMARP